MKSIFKLILVYQLFLQGLNSQPGPLGWASLNGGTTGGEGGDTVWVFSREDLIIAMEHGTPLVIMIADTVSLKDGEGIHVSRNNISIVGNRQKGVVKNGGFMIRGSNIIIRNLSIGDSYQDGHWDGKGDPARDCLTLYGKNIWIDHCELYHGFDGLLDISGARGVPADYITVSWTCFRDHNKVMLIGSNDKQTYARGALRVTIHHCWFDGVSEFYDEVDRQSHRLTQRLPRVRFGDVHVYNNYYESVASYCVAARLESDVVVERNFFRNLKNPHIIEDRGKGTEDPDLVAPMNIYENVKGRKEEYGLAFNPAEHYSYHPDQAGELPGMVMNGAGIENPPGNRAPVAADDRITIWGNHASIRPLLNDSDPDGDKIRISRILNEPEGGILLKPGEISYTRPETDLESDMIKYEIIDFRGGVSEATIKLILSN